MRFGKAAMAAVLMGVVTALSLTLSGAATAAPAHHARQAGKPRHHSKPKPPKYPQVSGNRLLTGLLPASAFGDQFLPLLSVTTASSLWPTKVRITPASVSCRAFETFGNIGGWGNTAGAQEDLLNNTNDFSDLADLLFSGFQNVTQFATPQSAATFYGQSYAKYNACPSVTLSRPNELGGEVQLTNVSIGKTTIGKYQAFTVMQSDVLSSFSTVTFYQASLVVLAGTDVYTINENSTTNDPVPTALMSKLISRVQALYPRH